MKRFWKINAHRFSDTIGKTRFWQKMMGFSKKSFIFSFLSIKKREQKVFNFHFFYFF